MGDPDASTQRPPSVDRLARSLADTGLPHPVLVDVAREAIAAGDVAGAPDRAERRRRRLLQPVVNATGVLLHTNLGRAPLEVQRPASYSNLELDLVTGRRGSRLDHVGPAFARLTGAEAAIAVNNGAAAVLLMLAAHAAGRAVAVSRGELVEIGGGFRIPDVCAASGARLVEVGTTNRTRADDYRRAIEEPAWDVAAVLRVHRSNYRITGFTEDTPLADLARLGPPVLMDLGSGLLDEDCPWLPGGPPAWLRGEPGVRQSLEAGATLVAFSGDKLLGGPQAGIIVGDADAVARCARHPLARALRPGGLVMGALADVADAHLRREAHRLPFWRMAITPVTELEARAGRILDGLNLDGPDLAARPTPTTATTGGGTLPDVEVPSFGIALAGDHTEALRGARPTPVIARVEEGTTIIDLRTVHPDQDPLLRAALTGPDLRPAT